MLVLRTALSKWVGASEASKELGFSENSLKCWRECGYLKAGKHWKLPLNGASTGVLYNLELCKDEMNEWWGRDALIGP